MSVWNQLFYLCGSAYPVEETMTRVVATVALGPLYQIWYHFNAHNNGTEPFT